MEKNFGREPGGFCSDVHEGAFDVLVGPDHLHEAAPSAGGRSVVSGNAMVLPEHYEALKKAMAAQDWTLATRLQRRTNALNQVLCEKNNIGCYKVVLHEMGLLSTAKMRSPMEEVSPGDRQALLRTLEELRYREVLC